MSRTFHLVLLAALAAVALADDGVTVLDSENFEHLTQASTGESERDQRVLHNSAKWLSPVYVHTRLLNFFVCCCCCGYCCGCPPGATTGSWFIKFYAYVDRIYWHYAICASSICARSKNASHLNVIVWPCPLLASGKTSRDGVYCGALIYQHSCLLLFRHFSLLPSLSYCRSIPCALSVGRGVDIANASSQRGTTSPPPWLKNS